MFCKVDIRFQWKSRGYALVDALALAASSVKDAQAHYRRNDLHQVIGECDDAAMLPVQQTIWTHPVQVRVSAILFETLRGKL